VSLGTVKRVRRALALRCVQQQRFRVQTTDSGHRLPVAPNLLGQDFKAARPDEVWTADITYVATEEGWLYVAAIKDPFAGEAVGRACGARMTTDLVVRAFVQAVSTRRPAPGLIHQTESRVAVLQPRIPGVVARLRGGCLDEPQGELL
jgi:putative transposase